MTLDELMGQVLIICPDAIFEDDKNGEIIIATGLTERDGVLVELDSAPVV